MKQKKLEYLEYQIRLEKREKSNGRRKWFSEKKLNWIDLRVFVDFFVKNGEKDCGGNFRIRMTKKAQASELVIYHK